MIFFKKGYFDILIAGILWGTIGLFVSLLNTVGITSSTSAFIRIGMGALILFVIILSKGDSEYFRLDKKSFVVCIILGIFSQGLFNFCYNESISFTGVATASVLLYTSPVFVCIMARIFFKEDISNIKKIALIINVLGCILTVTGGSFSSMEFSPIGVLFGVLAGFLYALMTIISKTTTDKYHPFTILFYSFFFGAMFLAITVKPFSNLAATFSVKSVLLSLGYGLVPTVLSYIFYMRGLSKGPETSKVPIVASVETVTAAIIGVSVLSESMSLGKVVGIAIVVLSIVIMNSVKQNEATISE